jgi:hypothetical protein
MKKFSIVFVLLALLFASFACQTLTSGGDAPAVTEPPASEGGDVEQEAEPPAAPSVDEGSAGVESEFPIPDGATNVMNMGEGVNFQAKMSLDEAMKFYMDALTKSGYTERPILTVTSDTTFSMVFDGHASGKAIVVQGVDLGDGSVNINIRLENT